MLSSITPSTSLRRGFTLVEVMIAMVLMIMLTGIAIGGMIFHGRMAQSNIFQQRIAEEARQFTDAADVFALDATIILVETGPSGANTVLTIGKPDPANLGGTLFKQFIYYDADGNPATITDNVILEQDVNDPMAIDGKQIVHYCSPVTGLPVFALNTKTSKKLADINLRIGDRTYPASNQDNAISGNGYQAFQIQASVSSL